MGRDLAQAHHEKAKATLVAMKEFKDYLEVMEKDLVRVSKKFTSEEIAQGAQLAKAGIREALHYVTIVGKVIEQTERAVTRRSAGSDSATLSTGEALI